MKNKLKPITIVVVILAVLTIAAVYLHGSNIEVLNPKGPIAAQERNLIVFALMLSLIVVIPVFGLLFGFAWRYRETNRKAKYSPNLDGNRFVEIIWWLIPSALIAVLAVVAWNSSHQLDPYKTISSSTPPLTIEVVALDWKWLFIYPKQDIASVNFFQFPVNTPLNFEITSDAPMNSFWIPQLGGQIYAMPGMSTQLHLLATSSGNYRGLSANISGSGFSGMTFIARASTSADFNQWVKYVKTAPSTLVDSTYNQLSAPSQNNPVTYYSSADQALYDKIIYKYLEPGNSYVGYQ